MTALPTRWVRFRLFIGVALGVIASTALFALVHEMDLDRRVRFSLIDQTGRAFTERDLRGRWNLVYFGFTNCPMVCPTQMAKMTQALERLDQTEYGAKIRPVFITVDPARDDVPAIAAYLTHFYPGFVGLTGAPAALQSAARSFKAIADTRRDGDTHAGIGHSSVIYAVDRDGRVIDYFPYDMTAATLALSIEALVQ